jgi:hypothetical protein
MKLTFEEDLLDVRSDMVKRTIYDVLRNACQLDQVHSINCNYNCCTVDPKHLLSDFSPSLAFFLPTYRYKYFKLSRNMNFGFALTISFEFHHPKR